MIRQCTGESNTLGPDLAGKVAEVVATDTCVLRERLRHGLPPDLDGLLRALELPVPHLPAHPFGRLLSGRAGKLLPRTRDHGRRRHSSGM